MWTETAYGGPGTASGSPYHAGQAVAAPPYHEASRRGSPASAIAAGASRGEAPWILAFVLRRRGAVKADLQFASKSRFRYVGGFKSHPLRQLFQSFPTSLIIDA